MEITLNTKPFLKNSFYEFNRDKKELLLYTRNREYVFNGDSTFDLVDIYPLLNGETTIGCIAKKLNMPIDYLIQIIEILVEKKLVIFDSDDISFSNPILGNLYQSMMIHSENNTVPKETIKAFVGRRIGVIGKKDICMELLKSFNNIFDLKFISNINDNDLNYDFLIAIDVFENINFFKEVNKFCYENNIDFIRITLTSDEINVGPIFIPYESACYQCWLNRFITNFDDPSTFIKIGTNYSTTPLDSKLSPGTIEVATGLIKRQIINFFDTYSSCPLVNNEYYLNLKTFDSHLSPVLKIPNCIICNNNTYTRLKYEVLV